MPEEQQREREREREREIAGNGDLRSPSRKEGRKVNVCQSSLQFFVRWSVAWLAFGLVKAYWIPDPKPSPDYETYVQMLPWHVIIQDFSARSIFFPFVASYFLWLLAFAQSPAGGFRPANHQPSIKAMQPLQPPFDRQARHGLERGHVSTVKWILDCNMGCPGPQEATGRQVKMAKI